MHLQFQDFYHPNYYLFNTKIFTILPETRILSKPSLIKLKLKMNTKTYTLKQDCLNYSCLATEISCLDFRINQASCFGMT